MITLHISKALNSDEKAIIDQLRKTNSVRVVKSRTYKEVPPIRYNRYPIRRVEVRFTEKVSKDTVEAIFDYLADIGFWGKYEGTGWLPNGKVAIALIDFSKSISSDYLKHKPLEMIYEYLMNGTPKRVTMGNTRALQGVGFVEYVVGN